jgi:hypothetical protein
MSSPRRALDDGPALHDMARRAQHRGDPTCERAAGWLGRSGGDSALFVRRVHARALCEQSVHAAQSGAKPITKELAPRSPALAKFCGIAAE